MTSRRRAIVPEILPLSCALLLVAGASGAQEKVNQNSRILEDFGKRVADYLKLHRAAQSQVQALKPTNSAEAIEHHEHKLAHRIREARRGAGQSDVFTPEISLEFRRLIALTMQGEEGERIRKSLRRAAPVRPQSLRVNGAYPAGLPLQSTPPSLLLNLPPLPPEVEYRVVGHDLILRDIEANLVIDFITDVVP
jgi:hypothetical protein